MRNRNNIAIAAILIITSVLVGFVAWAQTPPYPMPEAFEAMQSDTNVTVIDSQWLIFEPTSSNKTVGFIFYPGGRVDFRSYSPLAHAIANQGYLTVIVPMPLNLAVFGPNSANAVIDAFPNITSWAIGGHSLGGSMAAQYVQENQNRISGLILLAAYPASGLNLSDSEIFAVTIHGTNDGLVTAKQIDDSLKQLPLSTIRAELEGGNHAQFGWYGTQSGDGLATITREQQQNQTITVAIQLLNKLQ